MTTSKINNSGLKSKDNVLTLSKIHNNHKNKKNVQWRRNFNFNWDGSYSVDLKQNKEERQSTKKVSGTYCC
jgi:hypothetical protein